MVYYVIEIEVLDGVWQRVGNPYRSRDVAKSWVSFVKKAWNAKRARVSIRQCVRS